MATAPSLPLFYNGLEPLSSGSHATYRIRTEDSAPYLAGQHAVPLTIDEFPVAQRFMPIVFTVGDDPVPIALMGLNEGVNVFLDDQAKLRDMASYIPAYVRRYPYMLARLRPDAEELSLCFDPTSNVIGPFEDGDPVFENGEPTEVVKNILSFAETFEQAGQRTQAFMNEVKELDLLMEGEVTIQTTPDSPPYVYRGFMMVNEEKLNDLRGDQLRKMMKSGMLPLLHAHLFSLALMRDIFQRQVDQGKAPPPQLA